MLETGRFCLSCGKNKFLNDYDGSNDTCKECVSDNQLKDNVEQFNYSFRHKKKDPLISLCKCDRYFLNTKVSKQGKTRTQEVCELCQSQPLENVKTLNEEKSMLTTADIEKRKENVEEHINKQIKKKKMLEEDETEQKIGSPTMQRTENDTTLIKREDLKSSEMVVLDATHSTDTLNLSNNLRVENLNSMNLLSESAKSLTKSARALLKDEEGDFGEGSIRKPTHSEAELALKLALGANELLKTKLTYIQTGKVLINSMAELIQSEK